ncbi:MAG: hypothetical protein ACPGYP_03110 [Solirubrobacterales bacterium]
MTRLKKLTLTIAAVAGIAVSFAAAPTPVIAGTYKVYSCKSPDGRDAPTDGWFATGFATFSHFANNCQNGGSMQVVLSGSTQPAGSSYVGWGFDTAGPRIVDYKIHRSGTSTAIGHGTSALLYSAREHNDPGGARGVDYCASFQGCLGVGNPAAGAASGNLLHQGGAQLPSDLTAWYIAVGCGGFAGYSCSPMAGAANHGSAYVHAAEFTLVDDDAPQVAGVRGDIAHSTGLTGIAEIAFHASDAGSGVHRAVIEVDGVEVVSGTPNPYSGRCVRVGLAGTVNDFYFRQPCPREQPVEMSLSTGSLADGPHIVRVRVLDAAGNSTTVFGPKSLSVMNTVAPIRPFESARFDPDQPSRQSTNYGRRKTLSGRLLNANAAPLPNAALVVHEKVARAGAPRRRVATLVTDDLGRYRYRPPATASRDVLIEHAVSGASTSSSLIVTSRLQLRALRSRVPAFGRMILRGKIPSERSLRRVTVEIQAKSGRRWKTVGVRRATPGGVFTFRYKFRRTARASLQFRARARRSSDLPVLPRASRTVRLKVG